jgi:hypothetical protein
MERATIYRAISAPMALVGGSLSVITASVLWRVTPTPIRSQESWPDMLRYFLLPWLAVLAVTAAANVYFLRRDAQHRGDPFISAGMKAALRALFPPFLVAGCATFLLTALPGALLILPKIWMLCYGLGLLATSHFSPRSIHILGWSFLLAGLASLMGAWILPWLLEPWHVANAQMVASFGLFHLIYAACTWPRKSEAASGAGAEA